MRTRTTVTGMLAAVLLLAACGDDAATSTAEPPGSSASAAQAAFNQQDVDFAAGMHAHHAQAVEMAEMVLGADPTPEVADLAERIKAAQTPEIAELEEVLELMGEEPGSSDGHGSAHGTDTPMHSGMMTDEQMQVLEGADGLEACRQFLTLMQEHHAGAIASAEQQLAKGSYPPLVEMAESIRSSQAGEITEMQQLLAQL